MDIKQIISAQNCVVLFNNYEVGSLQNLTIQANNNTSRITNLWSEQNQSFVKGTSEYTISATRAFIDLDTYFGTVKNLATMKNTIIDGIKLSENDTRTPTPNDIGQLSGALLNSIGGLGMLLSGNGDNKSKDSADMDFVLKGGKNSHNFFANTWFDIVIKSPLTTALNSLNIEDVNNELWKLKDCKMVAKTVRIDVGTIIVLDNLTIFARQFDESYIKYEEGAQ